MSKSKVTIKALRTESPWVIAERLGLQYTGDMHPVPHCGTWYNTHDWHHGYAECVRITEAEGTLWLERGTINKPSKLADLESALRYCGWSTEQQGLPDNVRIELVEIESCLAYSGAEVDQCVEFITDNGKDWGEYPEFRIYQACVPMLLSIMPPAERSYVVRYACTGATIGVYAARDERSACRMAWREQPAYRDRKGELYAELA